MPSFEYQALTPSGEKRKGFIEADSERHARQNLREEGLFPVEVAPTTNAAQRKLSLSWHRPIPTQQVALFSRQLATLVDSGIPVEEALHASTDQTRHKQLRKIILSVRSRVREGHTLADGLSEHPRVFSDIFRSLTHAGERSGELGMVLNRLADYMEESQRLRSTLVQGLVYPIVLTTVAIGVVAILMGFVVPKVIAQFDHVNQQLPLLTRILINISELIQAYGMLALVVVIFSSLIVRFLLRKKGNKLKWHQLQLKLPLVSRLVVATNSARLLRTLQILSGSGVPLLDALKVAVNTVTNLRIQSALQDTAQKVQAGSSLHKALSEQQLFPPIAIYMIANGEKSGELDQMLDKAASVQEQQLTSTFGMFLALFEPAIIVLLGGVVLFIVLAIMLPILQLNNLNPL